MVEIFSPEFSQIWSLGELSTIIFWNIDFFHERNMGVFFLARGAGEGVRINHNYFNPI